MDTIGDAYVVAGLLPPEGEGDDETDCRSAAIEKGRVCSDMLEVRTK